MFRRGTDWGPGIGGRRGRARCRGGFGRGGRGGGGVIHWKGGQKRNLFCNHTGTDSDFCCH